VVPNPSTLKIDTLRKRVNGETVPVPSQLRIRLESAGVIREGGNGLAVTAEGRRFASQKPAVTPLENKAAVDRRGQRLPFQRRSVF
jgi:hypothetical protein